MPKSKVYPSQLKKVRALKTAISAKQQKILSKRPYIPGMHGKKFRRKVSDFGLQLEEKQKAKLIYGLREKQFKRFFKIASKDPKATGELLLSLLERRLDNVIYRSSFAKTRLHGRQLVSHAKFFLNDKKVNIPSIIVKKGDVLSVRKQTDKDKLQLQDGEIPNWIKIDKNKKNITIVKLPTRENAPFELNEQLIVEFYNR